MNAQSISFYQLKFVQKKKNEARSCRKKVVIRMKVNEGKKQEMKKFVGRESGNIKET